MMLVLVALWILLFITSLIVATLGVFHPGVDGWLLASLWTVTTVTAYFAAKAGR